MRTEHPDYISIRISTLRGDQRIPFDIYVKVAGKFILYCRQGESFEDQRLKRLRDKKIQRLFIAKTAEIHYREYLSRNIELAYLASAGKPIETRTLIVQGLQLAATDDVFEDPTDRLRYEVFKEDTKKYLKFLMMEEHALRCILAIENTTHNTAHHGVNVATLAVSLAIHLGETDGARLQLLATGCLLHDIEHFYSGLNVAKPIAQMNPEDLKVYHRHPDQGVDRVQQTQFYDQLVLKIIRHHHEFLNGSGFPDKVKAEDLDPMVMFAAVADAYDRRITYEDIDPKDAAKRLMIDNVGLHPLPLIQGLGALLKKKNVL